LLKQSDVSLCRMSAAIRAIPAVVIRQKDT
jgi:hypothetical protein